MKFETVIGLEIHVELSTKSKLFCGCSVSFGALPNTQCCPICLGFPGTLPVINKKAVDYSIRAGLALNCQISNYSKMDRKNYFYPDLPKAFQVSQLNFPICLRGHLDINTAGLVKRVGITRIHLEEDAGKLMHDTTGSGSLIDYNRGGTPLIEIVTEPDLRSAEETITFLEDLKHILEYIDVSDCKMQEGSLRCDVNISIRELGTEKLGTRVEIKNLNSFRSAGRAIEFEQSRQENLIETGQRVIQETRRWDENSAKTISMRSKEEANDYKYFPEPDLLPIVIEEHWLQSIKSEIPELPLEKKDRYMKEYGLSMYDAQILTSAKQMALLFEETLKHYTNPKVVANWLMGDFLRLLKENNIDAADHTMSASSLSKILLFIDEGKINNTTAKNIFEEVFHTRKSPEEILREKSLDQINDTGEIRKLVQEILDSNARSVEDYRQGKTKAIGFLVGQVMRMTKGKANPKILNEILIDCLENYVNR